MTDDERSEAPMTAEEFKRLLAEAKARGESTLPIVRRFAIDAIDVAVDGLDGDEPKEDGGRDSPTGLGDGG